MTVRLVRLHCVSCGSAMHGEPLDVLFLCDHCGAGALLGPEGLEAVESTALLPAPDKQPNLWRPAWVVEAEVVVSARRRFGGRETPGSTAQRTFVIPAFDLPLATLTRLARTLSPAAGATREVPHEPVRGGVLSLADAVTLAHHLVISEEIVAPDTLASLQVTVTPSRHRLAALPLVREGDSVRCAVSGMKVPASPSR